MNPDHIEIAARIYFGANMFFAGYYLSNSYRWQDTATRKMLCVSICFGAMLFGSVYVASVFVWTLLCLAFDTADNFLQMSFFFNYLFTRKYHELDESKLEIINAICSSTNNKNTVRDRIYRYCVSLVNKRNNYQPKTNN